MDSEKQIVENIMGEPPETFEEAVSRGLQLIEEDAKIYSDSPFTETEQNFVGNYHSGFGRMMRNHWGLWGKSSGLYREINEKYGLEHADDCSGLILHAIYCKKNECAFDVNNLVKRYKEHWEKWGK